MLGTQNWIMDVNNSQEQERNFSLEGNGEEEGWTSIYMYANVQSEIAFIDHTHSLWCVYIFQNMPGTCACQESIFPWVMRRNRTEVQKSYPSTSVEMM